ELRAVLEPGRGRRASSRILPWTQGGYRLDLTAGALDAVDFDVTVARAREATDPALYAQALAHWRGPVAADCGDRLRRHPAAAALAARRTAVALAYADLALDAGHFDEVADRLRPLAAAEPLDEALAARIVLAL